MPSPRAPAPSRRFERSRDYVQSLARGLAVLRTFDREHPAMTLAEISARAGLSRAAVRRLALTLQHLGYVRVVERDVSLTPRVLELGFSYLDSVALTELVQPRLEALSQRVHESCSMAVLDGQSIQGIADCNRIETRIVNRRIDCGQLNPLETAPGFAAFTVPRLVH